MIQLPQPQRQFNQVVPCLTLSNQRIEEYRASQKTVHKASYISDPNNFTPASSGGKK